MGLSPILNPAASAEQDRVGVLEPDSHIIGLEDGELHHGDIGAADGEDEGGAKGGSSHGSEWIHLGGPVGKGAGGDEGVGGEEGGKVGLYSDGSHTRTSASMGDAEGLVEVQVTYICSDDTRSCESNLSVHVGPVHVNLAAMRVNDPADLIDSVRSSPALKKVALKKTRT